MITIKHFVKEMNIHKPFGINWLDANVYSEDSFFVLFAFGECFKKKQILYGDIKNFQKSVFNFLFEHGKISKQDLDIVLSNEYFLIPLGNSKWMNIRDNLPSIILECCSDKIVDKIHEIEENANRIKNFKKQ